MHINTAVGHHIAVNRILQLAYAHLPFRSIQGPSLMLVQPLKFKNVLWKSRLHITCRQISGALMSRVLSSKMVGSDCFKPTRSSVLSASNVAALGPSIADAAQGSSMSSSGAASCTQLLSVVRRTLLFRCRLRAPRVIPCRV